MINVLLQDSVLSLSRIVNKTADSAHLQALQSRIELQCTVSYQDQFPVSPPSLGHGTTILSTCGSAWKNKQKPCANIDFPVFLRASHNMIWREVWEQEGTDSEVMCGVQGQTSKTYHGELTVNFLNLYKLWTAPTFWFLRTKGISSF